MQDQQHPPPHRPVVSSLRAIAFALLGLIWGSEWLFTRAIGLPPLRALGVRYLLAALVLALVAWLAKLRSSTRGELVVAAVTGVTILALPVLLTNWAESRISPGLSVVIFSMSPLITALIDGRATGGLLTWLVGGVGGTALLASAGLSFAATQWAGAAATLSAAIMIAASVVALKRRCAALNPVLIAATQFAVAAACVLLASLPGGGALVWTAKAFTFEVIVAVFGNAVAFPIFYWLLRRAESFEVTASQWLVTVVAVVESLVWVRGLPSWRIVSGVALVLASVIFVGTTSPTEEAPVTIEVTDSSG